ncbi:MAG: single-stranded-DNA-specific exonuclease RecJ [Pirellulales bacterium]|nr:single-stranded-DNA-specific exonuclease RecJ [Pirellulales bacterium]
MPKRWRIHAHDPQRIATLTRSAGVPAVVAQLLICRGMEDSSSARVFLESKLTDLRDPELLPGCAEAADRLHRALRAGTRICVYGDYDVDGITGAALLYLGLKLLGAEVTYYIPHRVEEGYGLHAEALRTKAAEGTGLIVTVDCGIGSVEEAALARELGVELLITDHHEFGPALPDAAAVVHPRLPGGDYPFDGLSGSGVAFKLAWMLCQKASGAKKVGPRMKDFLLQAVGLAALGTVADVVPLVDENRVLVRHGLLSLAQKPTLGLAALLRLTGLEGKPTLSSEDVGFTLGPRINAAGRLGQPQLALELLVTDRPERAQELAQYIDQLNATRQTLERSIHLAASKQVKELYDVQSDPALVLAERGWHPGVIGIVAGKLAEKFHRPTVLIGWDNLGIKPGVGSARSVPGCNLYAALGACREFLISYGGHALAAGLKIEAKQLDGFRAAFSEAVAAESGEKPRDGELLIDAEAPLSAFTLRAVQQMERLAPFGHANTRPLLCTSEVRLAEPPKVIGSGGNHLAMKLSQYGVTLRAVAFGGGEWLDDLLSVSGPIDVAFRPVINTFRGRQSVELHMVDWRAGQTGSM